MLRRKKKGEDCYNSKRHIKKKIINIAEYLQTNYKEDQFVNIFKSHERTRKI